MQKIQSKLIGNIKSKEFRSKIFPHLLGFFAVLSVIAYWFVYVGLVSMPKKASIAKPSPFADISIKAKSVYVYDMAQNRILYEKNSDLARPLASLTKVMTALTAESLAPHLDNVTVTSDDLKAFGDSGLKVDSTWTLERLIDYSLVVSSNDGASAIAAAEGAFMDGNGSASSSDKSKFIAKMNEIAAIIGMTNSKFMNEHGLDEDENHVGAYGSAKDIAKLFEFVLNKYPSLLEATRYQNLTLADENGDQYRASSTNAIVNMLPSLIASKTGFTDLAGGNLAVVFDAGLEHPVVVVVLGSTEEGRFEDTQALVAASIKSIQEN